MTERPAYWFPAKRYGWGWGTPVTWQGWMVLTSFVALLALAGRLFPPASRPLAFTMVAFVLCLALGIVCKLKGEPPSWRWGG